MKNALNGLRKETLRLRLYKRKPLKQKKQEKKDRKKWNRISKTCGTTTKDKTCA